MIHLVTALPAEADPLVAALRMRPGNEAPGHHVPGFKVFVGEEARLVVSGVGRVASAAATAHLHAVSRGEEAVWLNVGVGAHRDLPLGRGVVAHKIVEVATGRTWFPQLVAAPGFSTATLRTMDTKVDHAEGDWVYEMEASGFFSTAMRWATAELAGCVKVISDRGVAEADTLNRGFVREIVAASVDEIVAYGHRLVALAASSAAEPPVDLEGLLEQWHLTVTQRRQLRRLAVRAGALGIELDRLAPSRATSSRQMMSELESRLDAFAMEPR